MTTSRLGRARRPDYGAELRPLTRYLAVAVVACALAAVVAAVFGAGYLRGAAAALAVLALALALPLAYLTYAGRTGRFRDTEALADSLDLRGDERVLDVGSGSGLMLSAVARRLPAGVAVGLDLGMERPVAGGGPDALANARLEGVGDRVLLEVGDPRRMPFASGTFDAVVSLLALHEIREAEGRRETAAEIARVLKPGGRFVVADIEGTDECEAALRAAGCRSVERGRLLLGRFPPTRVISGVR